MRVVGQNDSRVVYIASSESCEPKRFVRCWNKVEKKYIQEKQPNQFHCYNQSMGFFNRMDQNMIRMKMMEVPVLFEWQMLLLFRVRGYCVVLAIVKGDDSLPLLAFRRHVVNVIF